MHAFLKSLGEKLGLSQPPNPEIKNLASGEGTCCVCKTRIKNKQIFMVPGKEGYYCRAHADEEAERVREESFSDLPEELKGKSHFSLDHGFYLECVTCSTVLPIREHQWNMCRYCHLPLCKTDFQVHNCDQKKEAIRQAEEAKAAKRCEFCGKKILGAFQCHSCKKYFCEVHQDQEYHDCKFMRWTGNLFK